MLDYESYCCVYPFEHCLNCQAKCRCDTHTSKECMKRGYAEYVSKIKKQKEESA